MPLKTWLPLAALAAAIALFLALGGERYLTFDALAGHRAALASWVAGSGALAPLAYILVYIAVTALSVPGAAIVTMAGGFLFGAVWGAAAALVGATAGAIVVFLVARTSLGTALERHAGPRLVRIEAEFRAHQASYLLMLRLVPVFPFWLVNLAAGLFRMRLSTFVLVSAVGMAPGAFVYASLGAGLDAIVAAGSRPNMHAIFAPQILLPLLALGALALLPALFRRKPGPAP